MKEPRIDKSPRRPKQKRSIQTRELIKKIGYEMICEKGIHATTTNEIAKRAGINISSFYNYFNDKETLLMELLIDFQEAFQKDVFSEDPQDLSSLTVEDICVHYITRSFDAMRKRKDFFSRVYPLRYMNEAAANIFLAYEKKEIKETIKILRAINPRIKTEDMQINATMINLILSPVINRYYSLGMDIGKKKLIQNLAKTTTHLIQTT